MPQFKCPCAAATGAWPACTDGRPVVPEHRAQALAPGARAQGAWWESFASWQSLTRERVALPVSGSCLGRGFWRGPLSCRRGQWEGSSGAEEGEAVSGAQGASCPHPGRGPSRVLAGQPGRDLGPGMGLLMPLG